MSQQPYSAQELHALTDASVALASEFSLDSILQKLVEFAAAQVGARYGALSVLDHRGRIQKFITTGISDEKRARIGAIPSGRGLLAVLLRDGHGLRLEEISKDPRSVGFPPHHPPMKSLLGVPVRTRQRIVGNLYVSEKTDHTPFSEHDEEMVRFLAMQAAVAVENADLHEDLRRRAESLARLEERERIAMDLHDGVIQTVYAVALNLEDVADRLPNSATQMRPDLERAMGNLDHVITDIRGYIFDLRPKVSRVDDLPGALTQLVDNVRVNALIDAEIDISDDFAGLQSEAEALAIFHIAQEALNNVMKHSGASHVRVVLSGDADFTTLDIEDDGIGFAVSEHAEHKQGFRNMRDRALSVGAVFECDSLPGKGTRIHVKLPVREVRDGQI